MLSKLIKASDTMSTAIAAIIYFISKYPIYQEKLWSEIATLQDKFDMGGKYPVLESVIKESMRLIPSVSRGGERVVPAGGLTIAGRYVPEGVVVRVPCYAMARGRGP